MKTTLLDEALLRRHPLPPIVDGDKHSKGRILVIAGSRAVPGAALLTGTAALRSGAGTLRIATVKSIAPAIGIAVPESMVVEMPEDEDGRFAVGSELLIEREAGAADAIVAGPGMEKGEACAKIASVLLKADKPIALDAGVLRALKRETSRRSAPALLLPHAGELASLLDCDERMVESDPLGCGFRAASDHEAIVLVKGVTSHIVKPDGEAFTYKGGTAGLGVSGSGDVLAGIVGGLLARGADPVSALLWAVWLHGAAGMTLDRKIGPVGYLARQIADEIPGLMPR